MFIPPLLGGDDYTNIFNSVNSVRSDIMGSMTETAQFDIPTHCKAGVVVNEGPNFHVEVQDVPVPEPGMSNKRSHVYFQLTVQVLMIFYYV